MLCSVKVSNSHVYTARFYFFFFLANLPVRLYSMLRELHQTLSSSVPLSGSKTVWVRMVLLLFSSLVNCQILMLLIWLKCSA